ncbi:hypothetical protein [Achromobacter xylosoxidans]|uniref:hypothetical protein n=1 Tax=Alcaligenes xylosoxydans xylosoxydans TaxID=85698 RepID=UPI0012AA9650|nr:hypothetical protein [Achromobacter xylosoxidans]CUR70325.1 hypothetical protein BN2877_57720 [Achromobacter xylosoxidans]
MRERPILFSGPMVRAILAGHKTQTRRVAKPVRHPGWGNLYDPGVLAREPQHTIDLSCPYGAPGDRLWVRESFWGCDAPGWGDQPCVVYDDEWHGKEYRPAEVRPWARKFGRIPSIHMPRDCSRITLEITGVRVERLHEISEADAVAEGIPEESEPCEQCGDCGWLCIGGDPQECDAPGCGDGAIDGYRALWEQINGAGSWQANPWVWVVEFRRIEDGIAHG